MYNKRISRRFLICLIQALFVFCCSGCGSDNKEAEIANTASPSLGVYNLACEKWVEYKDIEERYNWTITESAEDCVQPPGSDFVRGESCSVVWDGTYYSVNHFYSVEEGMVNYEYYLYAMNLNSLEGSTTKLEFAEGEAWSEEKKETIRGLAKKIQEGYARVVAVDMNQSQILAFLSVWNEEWYIQDYYVCEIRNDGKVIDVVDLQVDVWGTELLQKQHAAAPVAVCGKDGLFYLIDNENKIVEVIDAYGGEICELALQDCASEAIYNSGKTEEGIPVFEYINAQGQTTIFSIEEGKRKILYSGKEASAMSRSLSKDGKVVFVENGKLLCWDAANGRCQALYDLDGLEGFACLEIACLSQDEMVMVLQNKTKTYIYKLTANGNTQQIELELLQMYPDEYTKICAAEYSRKNPEVLITVTEVESDKEVLLNQTVEAMKKGEGPDMLLLDKRQLITLQDADCLKVLNDYLGKELEENIFAGALEFGRIGDSLYAVPYEASLGTLLVADATWNKSAWNIQEIISLVDEMESNGNAPERVYSIYYAATADQLLYDLCLRNIENTVFFNRKENTCHFENEEFYELLSFCKKMGEEAGSREYMTNLEMVEEVQSGEAVAYAIGGGLINYSQARAEFGEDYHPVGYPAHVGSGNQVHCYRGIAVNRWTEKDEIIKDFIQFMLSKENQKKYTDYWVRKDVILENIYEKTELSSNPVFLMDDYSYIELEGRADGTSYADEYIALMEGGSPLSAQYTIQDIILEEAGAYFSGDKTAQEVAGIIQSRVQLYLDENR